MCALGSCIDLQLTQESLQLVLVRHGKNFRHYIWRSCFRRRKEQADTEGLVVGDITKPESYAKFIRNVDKLVM